MKLKDVVIYSDMDGTMLTDWALGPAVPQSNLLAIKRLLDEGGSFAIASGRQYLDTLAFFPGIRFNAPLVQGNGTVLYDCQREKVLYECPLPDACKRESLEFVMSHPELWIVAADTQRIYQLELGDSRDDTLSDIVRAKIPAREFLEREFVKLVYILSDPAHMEETEKLISRFPSAPLVHSSRSSPIYLEVFPREADKASGVLMAVELAGLSDKKLVCIGDYYNDEPMLRVAHIAACPSNAPQDIKDICQIVTCDNNQGAIAQLIERLEML